MADEYWRLPYTADQLQNAATNQVPRINSTNKHWEVWDIDTSAWVDTGVVAQGLDGGVTSFNGRTGIVTPASGDYSSFYAPSGYGLGLLGTEMPWTSSTVNDFNNITRNGWYKIYSLSTMSHAPVITDSETADFSQSVPALFVVSGQRCIQTLYFGNYYGTSNNRLYKLTRTSSRFDDTTVTWSDWEWENPPLIAGTEYRTTERFLGKPVYKKLISQAAVSGTNPVTLPANTAAVVSIDGLLTDYGNYLLTAPSFASTVEWGNDSAFYMINALPSTGKANFFVGSSIYSDRTLYTHIKYTKTTD